MAKKVAKAKIGSKPTSMTATGIGTAPDMSTYAPTGGTLTMNGTEVVPQHPKTKNKYINNANKTVDALYGAYNTQYQSLRDTRDRATTMADTAYKGVARNAYNAYMQGVRNRRNIASNNGMTGGALEQMNVQAERNYNRNLATGDANRTAAIGNANQAFNTESANALANYQQNVANTYDEARRAALEAANARADYNLNYFQDTIARYDTVGKVNKAIKALKKSDRFYQQKKWMLEAQKAVLRAQ